MGFLPRCEVCGWWLHSDGTCHMCKPQVVASEPQDEDDDEYMECEYCGRKVYAGLSHPGIAMGLCKRCFRTEGLDSIASGWGENLREYFASHGDIGWTEDLKEALYRRARSMGYGGNDPYSAYY